MQLDLIRDRSCSTRGLTARTSRRIVQIHGYPIVPLIARDCVGDVWRRNYQRNVERRFNAGNHELARAARIVHSDYPRHIRASSGSIPANYRQIHFSVISSTDENTVQLRPEKRNRARGAQRAPSGQSGGSDETFSRANLPRVPSASS